MGYDQPALHSAAGWLIERFTKAGELDLSRVTLVLPGGRAGRRLLQTLVERWESQPAGVFTPPRIEMVGGLAERLYNADKIAGDTVAAMALAYALAGADAEDVAAALGSPPEQGDTLGWARAAAELRAVLDQLRSECLTPTAAGDATSDERWHAIARLEKAYHQLLNQQDLEDPAVARAAAVTQRLCQLDGELILLGVTELPGVVRQMLEQVADRVTALVFAAEEEEHAFDALGLLKPEAWEHRSLALDAAQVITVDRPSDQALAVVQAIERAAAKAPLSADQVTVGVGDAALTPYIVRRLEAVDIPARQPPGMKLRDSRPALLLHAAAAYLRTRRFDDLAGLARHPDLDLDPDAVTHWQTLLDRYITDHVQTRITAHWLGPQAEALKQAHDKLHAILPEEANKPLPYPRWSKPLLAMLSAVYGQRTLSPGIPDEALELGALSALADALNALGELDAGLPFVPQVTAAEAMLLLWESLGDAAVPTEPDREAVEVLGHLELPLDDAPLAIIAGVNEGMIPSSRSSDPLLPDALRRQLGLPDNRSRYARDLYVLHAVTRSRPGAVIITGKRSVEGDPLLPSRLLLACDEQTMVQRINTFYDRTPGPIAPPLLAPGRPDDMGLLITPPGPVQTPLNSLRVTAFKDYLACPYRFYLKHVLRLAGSDDTAVELTGGGFGTLAHQVLLAFGQSELAAATDAKTIADFFADRLAEEARDMFGRSPSAAVGLQLQQLDERLMRFAHAQALAAREGWRIVPEHLEQRHEATLPVDGEPFTITGQIDRIDIHPELGYRIIDYKTADKAQPPDKTHLNKGEWVDLQLPLYKTLAGAAGITGTITLGYAHRPRTLRDVGFTWAAWDEQTMRGAVELACGVVRSIREQRYWPPGEAPDWEDVFSALCYDRVTDRGAMIDASAAAKPGGRPADA